MAYYRIYCFGYDQHIHAFTEAHCDTDVEASMEARTLLARFTRVEVWERGRLVQRLERHVSAGAVNAHKRPPQREKAGDSGSKDAGTRPESSADVTARAA